MFAQELKFRRGRNKRLFCGGAASAYFADSATLMSHFSIMSVAVSMHVRTGIGTTQPSSTLSAIHYATSAPSSANRSLFGKGTHPFTAQRRQ
jgi:hypothetical protein